MNIFRVFHRYLHLSDINLCYGRGLMYMDYNYKAPISDSEYDCPTYNQVLNINYY